MYKANSSLSNCYCKYCGAQLYNEPYMNYINGIAEAQTYYDEDELNEFLDWHENDFMEDGACGKCSFLNYIERIRL